MAENNIGSHRLHSQLLQEKRVYVRTGPKQDYDDSAYKSYADLTLKDLKSLLLGSNDGKSYQLTKAARRGFTCDLSLRLLWSYQVTEQQWLVKQLLYPNTLSLMYERKACKHAEETFQPLAYAC